MTEALIDAAFPHPMAEPIAPFLEPQPIESRVEPAFVPPPSDLGVPEERALALPEERSESLDRLFSDPTQRGTALRAGAGLLATLPFAVVTGMGSTVTGWNLLAGILSIPVSLAVIAAVGMSASTIGVSLLSSPIRPEDAADAAARGLLRTGLVLLGLTPIAALWVASYANGAAFVLPSLAWGIAGVLGSALLNARFMASVHPRATATVGTLVVVALLTLFTVVLGMRAWAHLLETFHAAAAQASERIGVPV